MNGPRGVDTVLYEVDGAVARVTLNRPAKRNALDESLIGGLREALDRAAGDASIRVVTLTGAGEDFCAGADLAALQDSFAASTLENLADAERLAALFLQLRHLPQPVIALVRGRALAGGCGLASACDMVVATESSRFGYPEVRIGFVPAMVMAMLRRTVSEKRAFEMFAFGDTYSASEAERLGLVNRVVPDARFEEESAAFVAKLAERSATAIRLGKRLLYQQDGLTFPEALRAGVDVNVISRTTEATRQGVADFLSRRRER